MAGEQREVNGVSTWVEHRGPAGESVLLLHGGFSSTDEFESSLWGLADSFSVTAYDRRGHGRTPDAGEWRRVDLVDDAVALLESLAVGPAHVVGYSDGGVVAAGVAASRPDLVRSLTLMNTALSPSDWVMLPPEPDEADPLAALPPEIIDTYERLSPDGTTRLPAVLAKAAAFSRAEFDGWESLADYAGRVLVLAADDDLVTLDGQLRLFRHFRRAELAIIPGTSHDAPREKPELITFVVRSFLADEPVDTHIPIRR